MQDTAWYCIWAAIFEILIGYGILILWLQYQISRIYAKIDENNKEAKPMVSDGVNFYQDVDGMWRWQVRAENNLIIAAATEGYHNREDCEHNLRITATHLNAWIAAQGE